MTKKNKYTLAGLLIALLYIGASITGEMFPIGTTYLHDSTASIFTINKSVYIGGDLRATSVKFKELNSLISEDLDGMILNSDNFVFQTLKEEPLMSLDSSAGLELFYGDAKFNYIKPGTNANTPTYWIKQIKYKLGASTNSGYTFAHGVSNIAKIADWHCIIMDDSAKYSYAPLSWYAPYLFYAKITNTDVQITLPVGATGLVSDSAIFTLRINK